MTFLKKCDKKTDEIQRTTKLFNWKLFMDFIDIKYINLSCSILKNFHKKGEYLWNFSCPLCLDSHKNSRKARGYIFEENGRFIYYCHNCGLALSIKNFLKQVNPDLYKSFCFETFKETYSNSLKTETLISHKPKFVDFSIFLDLKKISELSEDDPFREFVQKRKIPLNYYSKLFACPNFMEWVNKIKPETFSLKSLRFDESRLVIPFIDKQKNIIAFQGRTIQNNNPTSSKYLTIPLNKNKHAIFGLDNININNTIYVLEGAIDSLFIPNSLAVSGSNLSSISNYFSKSNVVLIFDNERRNEQIVKKMENAINDEYNIVIWPSSFEYKDINEGIIDGLSDTIIMNIINKNIFFGLNAKLQLNIWRRT